MTTLAPVTTAVSTTPEVVGKALYLELKPILDEAGNAFGFWGNKDSVKQLIIMPQGLTPEGRKVRPSVWDRIVSPTYPRSQWSSVNVSVAPSRADFLARGEENYNGKKLEVPHESELDAMPEEVVRQMLTNFTEQVIHREVMYSGAKYDPEQDKHINFTKQNWEIVRQFAVEVTDKDLSDVLAHKTPQAVIRRINKVRVSLGLPEKLV